MNSSRESTTTPETVRRSPDGLDVELKLIRECMGRMEQMLTSLVQQQTVKDWYDVEEFAGLVGKASFTVREWARHGRILAEKRQSGRGSSRAWVVSHQELLRYQREGLMPLRKPD